MAKRRGAGPPKWLENFQRLTPEEQARRVAKWKPRTLVQRARHLGLEPFAPSTLKRLQRGTFTPSERTLAKLRRQIVRRVQEIPKAAPPSPPPTVSKWMTLFEWLKTFDSPDFNLDFSFRRLAAIGFRYVMQTTDGALLSDIKDTSGSMSVPNYWVYSITITDGGESEMWIQASEGAPHDEPLKQMEEGRKAVEEIEETNQRARDYSKLLEGHYSWWARGQNGEYNFIGIGVIHA